MAKMCECGCDLTEVRHHSLSGRNGRVKPPNPKGNPGHLLGKTGLSHPKWEGGQPQHRGPQVEWEVAKVRVHARSQGICDRCGVARAIVVHHLTIPS